MPVITVREYNPSNGALLGNISTLNYGRIVAGTHSRVKVLDVAFSEVSDVGNIKLGLISNAGITVNSNPEDLAADGSAANGHFGIESSSNFDSTKAASALTRHFAGVNGSVTAADANNVSVANRTETISDYVYLDVELSSAFVSAGNGAYKIFFDYS